MNSLLLILIVGIWLILGYKIYGRYIEKKLKISDKNKTPAIKYKDEIDFSPAKKPFLFGHHFASIAGAGPIIGPILAISYFGWLPVVLWISLGSVLIGGVHDYVTLISSVRNKAKSVSHIAKDFLSTRSGHVFGLIIWLTLILIITVFSASTADSIIATPTLVLPLLAISLIAIIMGLGMKKFKWNGNLTSLIALVFIFLFVWIGNDIPVRLPILDPILLKNIWISIIILYAGTASLLPIWFLLRPRDYLSALQLGLILLLGIIAIILVNPAISAPAYISSSAFALWPILFITVACGAASGFHSLVSSGTTSKQLEKESDAKPIAYGGMILEGILALVVTIVVITGVKWGSEAGGFQSLMEQGWIVVFSTGFGNIVGSLNIPLITVSLAALLGAFMVNQFILTSVDTSSRVSRFIVSDSLFPKLKNKYFITALTLIPAWLLAVTNSYESLWRLFGSANQLIAAIALITAAAYLVAKKHKVKYIIIPAIFMLVTTIAALIYLIFRPEGFLLQKNWTLSIISLILIILSLIISWEGFQHIKKKL